MAVNIITFEDVLRELEAIAWNLEEYPHKYDAGAGFLARSLYLIEAQYADVVVSAYRLWEVVDSENWIRLRKALSNIIRFAGVERGNVLFDKAFQRIGRTDLSCESLYLDTLLEAYRHNNTVWAIHKGRTDLKWGKYDGGKWIDNPKAFVHEQSIILDEIFGTFFSFDEITTAHLLPATLFNKVIDYFLNQENLHRGLVVSSIWTGFPVDLMDQPDGILSFISPIFKKLNVACIRHDKVLSYAAQYEQNNNGDSLFAASQVAGFNAADANKYYANFSIANKSNSIFKLSAETLCSMDQSILLRVHTANFNSGNIRVGFYNKLVTWTQKSSLMDGFIWGHFNKMDRLTGFVENLSDSFVRNLTAQQLSLLSTSFVRKLYTSNPRRVDALTLRDHVFRNMHISVWRDLLNEMGHFRVEDDGRLRMLRVSGLFAGHYSEYNVNNNVKTNSIYFARMLLGEYQTLNEMSPWYDLKLKADYLNRLSDVEIRQLNGSTFSVIDENEVSRLRISFFNEVSDTALTFVKTASYINPAARKFLEQLPSLDMSKAGMLSFDAPMILKSEDVVTFTLNTPTTNFTVGDVVVVGGTLSNFTGSGTSYTASLSVLPIVNAVTVSVARGNFSSSNINNRAFTQVMAVDRVAPNAPAINVIAVDDKINASEKLAGVVVLGTAESGSLVTIALGGIERTVVATGGNWRAQFTGEEIPADNISSLISVKVTDVAGNVSSITTRSMMIDTLAPTVRIDTNKSLLLLGDTAVLIFVLSEQSNDFGVDDVSVMGGVLSGFTGSGMRYTALFVGDAERTQNATVSIRANSFTDEAGNKVSITASANQVIQVDTLLPIAINSVSLSADSGVSQTDFVTNVSNQTVRGTLSRALLAGEVVQVSVDNGASWNNANVTDKNYSLNTALSFSNTLKVRVKNVNGVEKALMTQVYVYDETISEKGVFSVVGDVWLSREDKLNEADPKFKLTFTRDKVSVGDKVVVKVTNPVTGNFVLWGSNVTSTEVERGFKEIASLNSEWNDPIIAGEGVRVVASYVEDDAGNRSAISDGVQVLVTNDFTSLSSAVLNSLDAQLVENLPIGLLTEIANKAHIMNGLSTYFLSKLKADSISLVFLHGLTNVMIPVAMLAKLNATQIGALPVEFFSSHFPIEHINDLAQNFWNGVTPVQISYLSNEVINKLAINIANNTHAINLTKGQFRGLKGNNDATKESQLKSFFEAFYAIDLDNGTHVGTSIVVPYWILNALSSEQIHQLPEEIIMYCLPNLMNDALTNLNLLRRIGECSYTENVLLLPPESFQALLNNKLDAFLLPWVDSVQKENKNLPLFLTQRLSAAQMSNMSTNYPDILLKHMNVGNLTAGQLNGIAIELLSYLTPEWINKINLEIVGSLSEQFLNGLSDDNFMFLSDDFISRISRSILVKLSPEKIGIISLRFIHLTNALFAEAEMTQLNEAQLLAVFEGSVVDENGVERFANLTNVVGGLTAEKVRHVPWYILQGTIHNASMLARLKGEHVNVDSDINHYAEKYLSAKDENENSWFLSEATQLANVGKMDEAIQQIKSALFNADADALKLLKAGTINKLSTLTYSETSGPDALDWDSNISSPDYPIYSSVKELLFSRFHILTKDKVEGLNVKLIREFGKYIKDLNKVDLLNRGLNAQIQALSTEQLENFFNQWEGFYPLPYVLEILSNDQIKTISAATLSKIMDVNHVNNQSNHFLRGLGERAKLLGTTLLNQEQINTLSSRQLREFVSAWQEDGIYTLPVNITGMLGSAKVGELSVRALKMVGERAGKIDIEIDLGGGAIEIGDKVQLWLDGRLWQVFDASRIDFSQLSIDLSQANSFLGKSMLVRVLDKAGNLVAKSSNLILNLNAAQNVNTSWLNSLAKENLVGNLSNTFLENLSADVLDEYSEISAQFVNQIADFGELSSNFLNRLPSGLITEISASQINLLPNETVKKLGLDWDDVFTQIRSGSAQFDNVNKNGMEIELHLSQAVYLSDGKVAPQLVLKNGGIAYYVGGSGTEVLRFKYIFSGNEGQSYFDDGFAMDAIHMQGSSLISERGVKVNLATQVDKVWIENENLLIDLPNGAYLDIEPLMITGNEDGVNSAERAAGIHVGRRQGLEIQ
jgi:hypothetical protein